MNPEFRHLEADMQEYDGRLGVANMGSSSGALTAARLEAHRNYEVSQPRPESLIRDQITALEQRTQTIHAGISALEERLSTVLHGTKPLQCSSGEGDGRKSPTLASHMESRLIELGDLLKTAMERLSDLHARIDV